MDILAYADQLAKLGTAAVLMLIIGGLAWYILKVRDPHERTLESSIERISEALTQIAAISERNQLLFERQAEYLKDSLATRLQSLESAVEHNSSVTTDLTHKVDLLILSKG
jgi:hypothetical protein